MHTREPPHVGVLVLALAARSHLVALAEHGHRPPVSYRPVTLNPSGHGRCAAHLLPNLLLCLPCSAAAAAAAAASAAAAAAILVVVGGRAVGGLHALSDRLLVVALIVQLALELVAEDLERLPE